MKPSPRHNNPSCGEATQTGRLGGRWFPTAVAIVVLVISWGLGGGTDWGSWFVCAAGWGLLIGTQVTAGRLKSGGIRKLLPALVVWGGVALFLLLSVLNPSFERVDTFVEDPYFQEIEHYWWLPSTVNVARTIRYGCLLTGLMAFALALHSWRWDRRAIAGLLQRIYLNTLVLASVGAVFLLVDDSGRYLGFIDSYDGGQPFATFHYKNNWIAFQLLGIASGMALIASGFSKRVQRKNSRTLFFLLVLPILLVTIPLTKSRAGLLLLGFLSVCCLVYVAGRRWNAGRRVAWRWPVTLAVCILAVITIGSGVVTGANELRMNWKKSKQQYAQHVSGENVYGRILLCRDTVKMAMAKPWLGWGLGSFRQVFPAFQGSELYGKKTIDGDVVWSPRPYEFAHNDYLQLWSETGALGAAGVLLVPLVYLGLTIRTNFWHPLCFWPVSGVIAVALLALIDFPFGNEAVLVVSLVLLVLARKAGQLKERGERPVSPGELRLR